MDEACIYLKDSNSGQILATFGPLELSKAYESASHWESFGLEVKLEVPPLIEDLARQLGAKENDVLTLQEDIEQEIYDHKSGTCCPDQN